MQNYQKYLSIGQAEENWGIYVNTVGFAKVAASKNYPDNRAHPIDHSFTWNNGRILNGYYIVFITKGEGVLESAKTRASEIKAGTCFLLFPGIWHRYKPLLHSGWEEYWVGFNGKLIDEFMKSGIFNPDSPVIKTDLNEDLLQLFHLLISTVRTGKIGYQQIIPGITLQMLGLLNSICKFQYSSGSKNEKLVSKAKFLLQESIEKPVSLEEIAKELPMGYSSFRKVFKEITGVSPNQYHLDIRLEKAKNLLQTTNLTIKEVAYQTGFESIFYFSRMFKKKNEVTPKEFKNT